MADIVSRKKRSEMMGRIGSRNTCPEIAVRQAAHGMGFRFRIHRRDLPGTPDIVFPRFKAIIFVHGCFWHRHPRCRFAYSPKSRKSFWAEKFRKNVERDRCQVKALRSMGWRILVIWECQTADRKKVGDRIAAYLMR